MIARTGRRVPIVLTWGPYEGVTRYRVLLRDATVDATVRKLEVDDLRLELDPKLLHPDHRYEWSLQGMSSRFGEWEELMPYLAVLRPDASERALLELTWDPTDVPSRVVVHDNTTGLTILKAGVLGNRYPLPADLLVEDHVYSYTVQEYRDGAWRTIRADVPLAAERRTNGDAQAPLPARPAAHEEHRGADHLFLWTCDTEVNLRLMRNPDPAKAVDHHIFCTDGNRQYGIVFMMELLEQFGMRGTFFVDVLMEYLVGRRELERVIAAIAERGHDIQLHVHPSPNLLHADDPRLTRLAPALVADDPDLFREMLALAVDLFERRVGRPPIAFRSGAYHICDAFLEALPDFGIRVDSSLYPFKNCRVSPWMRTRTQPFWVGSLLEVPVTWLVQRDAQGMHRQQLAPVTSGRQQDAAALAEAQPGSAPATFVYLAHSFSLLSAEPTRDPEHVRRWNDAFRRHCGEDVFLSARLGPQSPVTLMDPPPDQDRIALMTRLLQGVSSRGDARGATFRELVDGGLSRWPRSRKHSVDLVPMWDGLARDAATTAATRVYSRAYLEAMEAAAPAGGDR